MQIKTRVEEEANQDDDDDDSEGVSAYMSESSAARDWLASGIEAILSALTFWGMHVRTKQAWDLSRMSEKSEGFGLEDGYKGHAP